METEPARVVFRKFVTGEIIAVFPDWLHSRKPSVDLVCYQHIGQHGACDPDIATWTEPANPEEYAPLLAELGRIGYAPIKILQRIPRGIAR